MSRYVDKAGRADEGKDRDDEASVEASDDDEHDSDREFVAKSGASGSEDESGTDDEVGARARASRAIDERRAKASVASLPQPRVKPVAVRTAQAEQSGAGKTAATSWSTVRAAPPRPPAAAAESAEEPAAESTEVPKSATAAHARAPVAAPKASVGAKRVRDAEAPAPQGGRQQRFEQKSSKAPPARPRASAAASVQEDVRLRLTFSNGDALKHFLKPLKASSTLTLMPHTSADFSGVKIAMISSNATFAVRARYGCRVEVGWRAAGERADADDVNSALMVLPTTQLRTMLACVVKRNEPVVLTLFNSAKDGVSADRVQLSRVEQDVDTVSSFSVPLQDEAAAKDEAAIEALEAKTSLQFELPLATVHENVLKPAAALKVNCVDLEAAQVEHDGVLHSRLRMSFMDSGGSSGATSFFLAQRVAAPDADEDYIEGAAVLTAETRDALEWATVARVAVDAKTLELFFAPDDVAKTCTIHVNTEKLEAEMIIVEKVYAQDIAMTAILIGLEEK